MSNPLAYRRHSLLWPVFGASADPKFHHPEYTYVQGDVAPPPGWPDKRMAYPALGDISRAEFAERIEHLESLIDDLRSDAQQEGVDKG